MSLRSHLEWQCERLWSDDAESFESAILGVGPEEAEWQDSAYAEVEREAGWPKPGSVFWHVAHLREYQALLLSRLTGRADPVPSAPAARFDEEVERIRAIRREVARALRSTPESEFENPERVRSLQEFFFHDLWNCAQVLVARRLYRESRSGSQ